jgi:dipeptidase D
MKSGSHGARNLDKTLLSGKILINLDSEDEDSCLLDVRGIDTIAEFDPSYDSVPDGYCSYNIILSGLTGGHSGDEIDKGHANSVKLIARLLYELEKTFNLRISSVVGGHQHNAIPRESNGKGLHTKR